LSQYLTDLPEERLAKYELMAAHAHEQARAATTPDAKNAYLAVARAWESMVDEVQRMLEVEALSPDATLPLSNPLSPDR
jgi:hypothetical protein